MSDVRLVILGSMDPLIKNVEALVKQDIHPALIILPMDRDVSEEQRFLDTLQISHRTIKDINKEFDVLECAEPDIVFCFAFPQILKKHTIDIAKLGVVNFHTSALPRYRGRHPVNWALIAGEEQIGITAHFVDESLDGGDIILQDVVAVRRDDDIGEVQERLLERTRSMAVSAFRQLASGTFHRMPQDEAMASYQPPRVPEDGRIDWALPSEQLHSFINALASPYPNAFCNQDGSLFHFERSYRGKAVGEVVAATEDGLSAVATSDGIILVKLRERVKVGQKLC